MVAVDYCGRRDCPRSGCWVGEGEAVVEPRHETYTIAGSAATGEPFPQPRTGILRRRDDRRFDYESGQDQRAPGCFTDLRHAVQRNQKVRAADCPGAEC